MTEEIKAYCMKCKAERTIQNVQIVTTKNGRPAANGACPVCGTKMFKFLPSSYKAMAAPAAEAAPAAPADEAAPAAEAIPASDPAAAPAPDQPAA
jgi:predicted  nucleic acid-binding Zn-ribbon protein